MTTGIMNGNTAGVYMIRASLTPAEVATIVAARQTFTVPKLNVGDMVLVNPPSESGALSISAARVSAANTLEITWVNPTAGALTPTAGTYTITVFRPESGAAAALIGD